MANILSQHWLLSRRHVLRGLGISLALPLLDCMRPLLAADKATRPKRSAFFYLPNGVNTAAWEMNTAGADYQLSKPLAALEKHRKIITPISGCTTPTAWAITTTAPPSGSPAPRSARRNATRSRSINSWRR